MLDSSGECRETDRNGNLGSERKIAILVLLMDVLSSLALWYLFLCLLNAAYVISGLLAVSYFFALRLATSAVLLLFSGVLADRFGIFKVLASSLMLVIPLLIIIFLVISVKIEGWLLPLVLVLGVITEALTTVYNSLKYALPPIISRSWLEKLNATFELSYSIMMVAGPLLATFLIHLGFPGIIIAVLSQMSSILALSALRPSAGAREERTSPLHDLIDGARILAAYSPLKSFLLLSALLSFGGGIVNLLLVPLAAELAPASPFIDTYSLIIAGIGAGSAAASIILVKYGGEIIRRAFPHSAISMAIYPTFMAFAFMVKMHLVPLLIVSMLNGLGNSIVSVALTTLIQGHAPRQHIAKIMAVISLAGSTASMTATVFTGMIARDVVGKTVALLLSTIALASSLLLINNYIKCEGSKVVCNPR